MRYDSKKLQITDLIAMEMLQTIQRSFSTLTGFSAVITNADGIPVLEGSNFSDFCVKHIRSHPLGKKLCDQCNKFGAHQAYAKGKPFDYYCHVGLIDFAAPIVIENEVVGCFVGGQVATREFDEKKLTEDAKKFGADCEEYISDAKKIKIVSKKQIEESARSLFDVAKVLSHIAYDSYLLKIKNAEVEESARAKSDFLANMSHEIRTPMNAVLGMAEMALREEMSPAAREYIHQIMFSGKNLLVIINDILDISKIESGKMEINHVVYESMSMFNDLASIVNNRIGEKEIEFTMDIDPCLPQMMMGDSTRVQQVLINLLNNAVKFTKAGEVHLKVEGTKTAEDMMSLRMSVSDTGIGIRKEDLGKLFKSFQQVDSKRNRNIEGTGLGLAISQNLIELMGGKVSVESEYEKGSTFTIQIPQKIVSDLTPMPDMQESVRAALLINNEYVKKQVIRDLKRLKIKCFDLSDTESMNSDDFDFLIAEDQSATPEIREHFLSNSKLNCVIITSLNAPIGANLPRVRIVRKPVYYLNLYAAMGFINEYIREDAASEAEFSFTAPDAHVLIVDDNAVNLTVARGLLTPLKMQIDTATSAAQAIDIMNKVKYDLIFMDHMMPEVDGIDTTHIIRRLMPAYENTPIIALTANAIAGMRDLFIEEGMNDFVAKPIDTKDITAKLRKWLPQEKIIPLEENHAKASQKENKPAEFACVSEINFLNIIEALSLLKTEELFWVVLKEYYTAIDKKAASIALHRSEKKWKDYTIEVHALKSTSRQIGADELADLAAELEKAGKEENIAFIEENTDKALSLYMELKNKLSVYFPDVGSEEEKRVCTPEDIIVMLDELDHAIADFDTLLIDEVVEEMSKYQFDAEYEEIFRLLKEAAENGDIDACGDIERQWKIEIVSNYMDVI